MDSRPIIIVSGLGRSGTSLVMQMLVAGGVELGGTGARYPTYECQEYARLPHSSRWLSECHGRAIKILNPYKYRLPVGLPYKIIWTTRNLENQAGSWMKWQERLVQRKPRRKLNYMEMKAFLRRRHKNCMEHISELAPDILYPAFEGLIQHPEEQAGHIAEYLGLDLNLRAMAQTVITRSPECYDGFLEDSLAVAS